MTVPYPKNPADPQQQYDFLKWCAEHSRIDEWNKWRFANSQVDLVLDRVDLSDAHLENADFCAYQRVPRETGPQGPILFRLVSLKDANLSGAHLTRAQFFSAHLEGTDLSHAILDHANLHGAHLEKHGSQATQLQNADLTRANLCGTDLTGCKLEHATLRLATVNESTLFEEFGFDKYTDFTGVALDAARIEPSVKDLLKYSIRWSNWRNWYKMHKWLCWLWWPIPLFWWISDYGRSTLRIILSFFLLAFLFALGYYRSGLDGGDCMIANLFNTPPPACKPLDPLLIAVRAVYFSIVTMTTLGFGDMHAAPGSPCGHLWLTLQVILGYVLLGALITRFTVLFQAGGPGGRFPGERIWRWF